MKAKENVPEMQQFYGNRESSGTSETDQNSVEPINELVGSANLTAGDFEFKGKLRFRTMDVYKYLKAGRVVCRGFFENNTPVAIERVQKILWTVSTNQFREFDQHENIVRYYAAKRMATFSNSM
jgi:hypothetical protein